MGTGMKQSETQYTVNIAAVEKSLLPAVLAPTVGNGQMVSGYMLKTFQQNGVVDASVENLRKAVAALKDQLEWTVPPAKRPGRLSDITGRKDQDAIVGITPSEPKEHLKIEGDAYNATMQALNTEHDKQIVSQAQHFIDSFGGRNMRHSQRFEAKEKLQARWNELLQRGTKPSKAFESLKAFSDTLFPTDLGSIR